MPLSIRSFCSLSVTEDSAVVQRLKSRAQFQAVMAGAIVAKTPHFALHRLALNAAPAPAPAGRALFPLPAAAWLGVLLPKRWARRAVTRNTIRRQIYEVARAQAAGLPQAALVVRLRSEFSRQQFPSATSVPLKRALWIELNQLLGRVTARRPAEQAARAPVPDSPEAPDAV